MTRRFGPSLIVAALLLGVAMPASASDTGVQNALRAQSNYMLNCQGCHGARGDGTHDGSVPSMQGKVGDFLKVGGGREFLVQVPGSANAALGDVELAEVLNWIVATMAGPSLPDRFEPYTPDEVGLLRRTPLSEVERIRTALLSKLPHAGE